MTLHHRPTPLLDPSVLRLRIERLTRRYKKRLVAALVQRRFTLPPELRNDSKITDALACIKHRWPDTFNSANDCERPVFLFSAGWRSGSTLLQRLIVSSGEIVMWGEPLGETGMIARLAHSLTIVGEHWPTDNFFAREDDVSNLSNEWIANFSPDMAYLRTSHRALFHEWLATSARDRFGDVQWGLKEVRLTIHHARYLKWLYPHARFVFIYRSPYDAYRSWKGHRWVSEWPGYYSRSPIAFARHWRHLLSGYLDGCAHVNGVMVKYEDLIAGRIDFSALAKHIGIRVIDPSPLERRIGSPVENETVPAKPRLNPYDRAIITSIGGRLLVDLGYR